MTTKSVVDATAELYRLLEGFTSEERSRILKGTAALFGDVIPPDQPSDTAGNTGRAISAATTDPRTFFESKAPNSKIEELAVAARFRELSEKAERHTREQFSVVITGARRNFDGHNFSRDINNARNGSFFNKGGSEKDGFTLSYYGQNYVDALPDRDKAKKLKKPKKAGGRANKTK